jgi:hypothetical protein
MRLITHARLLIAIAAAGVLLSQVAQARPPVVPLELAEAAGEWVGSDDGWDFYWLTLREDCSGRVVRAMGHEYEVFVYTISDCEFTPAGHGQGRLRISVESDDSQAHGIELRGDASRNKIELVVRFVGTRDRRTVFLYRDSNWLAQRERVLAKLETGD